MTTNTNTQRTESLGPAERIINALIAHTDHLYHNRPGMVTDDRRTNIGVRWEPVIYKPEGETEPKTKVVYRLAKQGKKSVRTRIGTLNADNTVRADTGGSVVGQYREAGIYPEVAAWIYTQIAEVWKLDNEFAARWASYAFKQEHRDLKVALAAFMLVQSRKGDPVLDGGKVAFHDDDFRDVGEAMMLTYLQGKDDNSLSPKHLLRIHELLSLPQIAQINRDLGFGTSARHPFLGRWAKAVEKWLRYREENPKLLDGLVKAGFRRTVMMLAKRIGYKPTSLIFFQKLRWKQVQSKDGRRSVAIGVAVEAAVTWNGLTEREICERIGKEKPNWKVLTSNIPSEIGLTRAIVAAAIESGALSNKDMVILTPTFEDLGLLNIAPIKAKWQAALKEADDMRAINIARNVQSQVVKDQLQEAAEKASAKAIEEVVRNLRIYFIVDTSGSMEGAIEAAKVYLGKLLPAFPPKNIHVATFNSVGKEIAIKHPSQAGVDNAFLGIKATGSTDYGEGVRALQKYKLLEGEDALFFFVGDEEAQPFDQVVRASGLNPVAFAFVKTKPNAGAAGWRAQTYGVDNNIAVRETARRLNIPCFMVNEEMFDDVYAVGRTLRNLIATTPVSAPQRAVAAPRQTLIDQILNTDLLKKPVWAEG